MLIPALAVPVSVVATVGPVKENTISKRSPGATVTGAKFAEVPDNVSSTAMIPVNAGVKSTDASVPVNVLLPAGARKMRAFTVPVPGTVIPTVTLKLAEIEVMLPSRGTVKASVKSGSTKSIVSPVTVTSGMAVPNPTRLAVPINPPRAETKIAGTVPEENGIIAPVLLGGAIHAVSIAINGPNAAQRSRPVPVGGQ